MKLPLDPPEILQLTVSQFSDRLRRLIEEKVPVLRRIKIVGEISGWKAQPNGNVYFTLKDANAVLRCFAFSGEARRFSKDLGEGVAVVATGSIGVREQRSEYQLRVLEIEPFGAGSLAAKVEALRKRLELEGLFNPARKRKIPRFVNRVALVSARGKGAEDFETTLREKAPNVAVAFIETRVQGDGAEIDIAEAIDRASRLEADVIAVVRGGGSAEDLFPFNMEPVVRAIVRARHPVITGIAHTTDRHLADEAADDVFKTPTAAAESIAQRWSQALGRIDVLRDRLARAIDSFLARAWQRSDAAARSVDAGMERRITRGRSRLLELSARLERQHPRDGLAARALRLSKAQSKLDALQERIFSRSKAALELAASRLRSADPLQPLERGYAIVTLDGRALRDAAQARAGDAIEATLHRGSLRARVEGITPHE